MSSLDLIYQRDEAICWLCNEFVERDDASRDHIIPHSFGGPNRVENYALAHRQCNSTRGNHEKLPSQETMIDILAACQKGLCGKCCHKKTLVSVYKLRRRGRVRPVMTLVCAVCAFTFGKGSVRKLRSLNIDIKENPMEMTVVDRIRAYQVEENDYIRFRHATGRICSGIVQEIVDSGDEITIVVDDDESGERIECEIHPDYTIEVMAYEGVRV